MSSEERSSILIIYTGGTIGMIRNSVTGALESFNFDHLLRHVPELRQFNLNISSRAFNPPIDSSDMNPALWGRIVEIIHTNYDKFDGFVILHGTDTMAFTASALSFMLEGLMKPVILTGSQLPIGVLRTDGKENLLTAIEIAAAKNADGSPVVPEVCIYFHQKLMRGNRCTKTSADSFDAFNSPNCTYLATAGMEILYNRHIIRPYDASAQLRPNYKMSSDIIIFSLFPGIKQSVVEKILSGKELKGIIFRTFGAGNAPQAQWLVDALERATAENKVIVNVTQCSTGSVKMRLYETGLQLLEAGIISGRDMTVEAALTKMMFLLGQSLPVDEVRRLMKKNLAGEITCG
ncbi:MAG: type I asparaginase [Bacteroidaceae bacterium]|nr:type I asparaginase [Bacteroidaceae bacterium]